MLFNRLESSQGLKKSGNGNSEASNGNLKNSIAATHRKNIAENIFENFSLDYIKTFLFTTVVKKDTSFFILDVHLDPLDE